MSRVARRAFLGGGLVLVLTLLLTTGLAQVGQDPRNNSEDFFDAVNGANCYAHHGGEGFDPMQIGLAQRYAQMPIGEMVNLSMRVRHVSQIDQTIQQISVVVNVSQAPNVLVITPETVLDANEYVPEQTLRNNDDPAIEAFEVLEGASELFVSARATGERTGGGVLDEGVLSMTVKTAGGQEHVSQTNSNTYEKVELDAAEITDGGFGTYRIEATWDSDLDPEMTVEMFIYVNYTQTQTEFTLRAGDEVVIRPGEGFTMNIPVIIRSADEAILDFRVQSISFWEHSAGDGAPRDDGLYFRFTTMKVRGGDSFIESQGAFGSTPVAPAVELYGLFTRVIGFVTLFVVPIAMITGGMFGKASRRWLNKITGGAKKRVMWHNAMSFIIIGVASLHFLLALIEEKFLWTKGLFWGGVGWLLLVSLGFTGYYQVRMIKRWNYKVWRHTHLWSAVAVLVFGMVHTLLDGSDLASWREALGPWHERLIWP